MLRPSAGATQGCCLEVVFGNAGAHMEAEHPEFKDWPILLCERGAKAVGLLCVC